jgi:hypothetical protein
MVDMSASGEDDGTISDIDLVDGEGNETNTFVSSTSQKESRPLQKGMTTPSKNIEAAGFGSDTSPRTETGDNEELDQACERLRKRERALGNQRTSASLQETGLELYRRTVVTHCSRSLSFEELSRAENTPPQIAHTRTKEKKTRQDRNMRRILRKAAVKTTWAESLEQDSSLCLTLVDNFNLCEKFDENKF